MLYVPACKCTCLPTTITRSLNNCETHTNWSNRILLTDLKFRGHHTCLCEREKLVYVFLQICIIPLLGNALIVAHGEEVQAIVIRGSTRLNAGLGFKVRAADQTTFFM